MKCNYVKLIARYLDNELSFNEKNNLEAHLKDCAACSQELKNLKLMKEYLAGNKIDSDAGEFINKLNRRLERRDRRFELDEQAVELGSWARRLMPVPVGLALAAFILLFVLPVKESPIDTYLFGTNFSNVSSLIAEPGG